MSRLWAALSLLVALGAQAATLDDEFLASREAFRTGNAARLEQHAARLKGHVLAPYVHYWQLTMRLQQAPAADVRAFLAANRDGPLAERLRNEWLKVLGRRGDWELFNAELPLLTGDDIEVTCYALQGRMHVNESDTLPEVRPLWFVARDLPESCTPLFEVLIAAGKLTSDDLWTRFRLALEAGKVTVVYSVTDWLPEGQAPEAQLLQKIASNPAGYLERPQAFNLKTRAGRETVLFAVHRLARTSPQLAANHWMKIEERFSAEDRAYLWGILAYLGAVGHVADALDWYTRAGDLSDAQLAWKARAALRSRDWKQVLEAIDAMTGTESADPAWRYWKARALNSQGRAAEATALLKPLSGEFNFYGQLAKEDLGGKISLPATLYKPGAEDSLRMLVPGEELCKEGEFHQQLCVVLSGMLEQQSAGVNGVAIQVLKLAQGSFFGEMGVLSDSAEPFSVVAQELSIVLEAPKIAVVRLMEQAPTVRASLDALYEKRALWSYSRNPGGLGALPEAAVAELLWSSRLELLPTGSTLFNEHDTPRDLFLVRSGFLRASQREAGAPGMPERERVLTYFREGTVFGVLPLLARSQRMGYSVQAASRSEVIRVPGAALSTLFTRYPQAEAALRQAGFQAEALAMAENVGLRPPQTSFGMPARGSGPPQRPRVPADLAGTRRALEAEVLVEEGLAKGREILVIDQEKCTACSNCIDACERRHGNSRLQLRGIQVENYMFPTACRHCDDPTCLMCSVDGIIRLPSGEIKIVPENCIGCGSCAQRCPYGNISMHPVEKPEPSLFVSLLDFLATGSLRERALEAVDPKEQRVAVKCDLCAEYSDYACVTACPVGAAFRIDPGEALANAEPRNSVRPPA